MFAFAAGLTKIYESVDASHPDNEAVLNAFGSFGRSFRTTYWAIFALVELDALNVSGARADTVEVIGEMTFGLYMVGFVGLGAECLF